MVKVSTSRALALALAHLDAGRLDLALLVGHAVVQASPDSAETHYEWGRILVAAGRLAEAEAAYRQALAIEPRLAEAANNLGNVLLAVRRPEEAESLFRRALELQPHSADFSGNLGRALQALGRTDEAETAFRNATLWAPDHALAWSNLAVTLRGPGRGAEALAAHRRAVELLPPDAPIGGEVRNNLAMALLAHGRSEEAEAEFRQALALRPDQPVIHSGWLACLQYRDSIGTDVTPERLAREHAAWNERHASAFRAAWPKHDRAGRTGRPLHLGFVSADLGQHPVGFFLVRTLENLDRRQCRVTCYHDRVDTDAVAERIRAASDVWVESSRLDDDALARRIREDQIDILFDMSGHTAGNRLLVFARKPAPIQIAWIGYPGTTGLEAIDYLLADRHQVPPESEAFYCERVLRLPHSYVCYSPPAYAPDVTPLPALSRGAPTFGCFNNPAKVTPRMASVWAAILRRVPGSRLLLQFGGWDEPGTQHRYRDLLAAQGVDPARLEMRGWTPHADLLAAYGQVDLALDTSPYSGGLTTCEALWMGVPVVTCPGPTFASRHALSYASTLGLVETIARDLDDYVERAVSLAGDLAHLAELRSGLRARMSASPLCDGPTFARQFLELLFGVWRDWLNRTHDT